MTGVIKRIVRDRGFGFIREAAGTEYFFHRSQLSGIGKNFEEAKEGDNVEFEVDSSADQRKGPRCLTVQVK